MKKLILVILIVLILLCVSSLIVAPQPSIGESATETRAAQEFYMQLTARSTLIP